MARSPHSWGIDIGKCAIKAVRGRMSNDDPPKFVADAFDYIEYPMILSQPEADPIELVQAALREFASRNDLGGCRVAVGVPGQLGLTKFIKLPPIEARKIPDIVRYEARQQIPFPLEQVVWDWQRLAGGMEEGGFVIDAEVAIFAMKRDQVYKSLEPLRQAGIDVDILQLTPIALANMAAFDQLPRPAATDAEQQPPYVVVVSIGVDTSDLVISNGLKIWQRSMPIGGNSFTKSLIKDLRLTFAKAEQVKRNAVRAEDPRAVFAAMRPVFKDFAAEVQRSLSYFTGTDRSATIGKVLLLGNAARLRGLADFVAKQVQLDVQRLDTFKSLEGPGVVAAPTFRENKLAFGTAYGLALQAAGGAALDTNLMPREIVRDRMIAEKRPWAVGALVSLLAAALVSFGGLFIAWKSYADPGLQPALARADATSGRSRSVAAAVDEAVRKREAAIARQAPLVQVYERRFQVLDMLRAVETLLPRDPPGKVPADPADRREIHVDGIDCEYFTDLTRWFAGVRRKWQETHAVPVGDEEASPAPPPEPAAPPDPTAPVDPAAGPAATAEVPGPTGAGWVVQIKGHHFHNEDRHKPEEDEQFVRSTLVKGLLGKGDKVLISAGPRSGEEVPVGELGIGFPVIVESSAVKAVDIRPPSAAGAPPAEEAAPGEKAVKLRRYDFVVQFVWQPPVPGVAPASSTAALPAGAP